MAGEGQEADATTADERRRWWTTRGQVQLRQLLYWLWDPIGVNDYFPNSHDEYDSYADAMGELLVATEDEQALAAGVLEAVRRAQAAMGFEQREDAEDDSRNLTEMILEWRRQSIGLWKEFA